MIVEIRNLFSFLPSAVWQLQAATAGGPLYGR